MTVETRAILWAAFFVVLTPSLCFSFGDSGQINAEVLRANAQISGWASGVVDHQVGPLDYLDPGLGIAGFGSPTDVLGSSGTPFSLGDGGWITLRFDRSIENGPGVDFAVFENSFAFGGVVFAELAFVEVSTDGVEFARLPALSRVERDLGAFDGIDSGEVYNLAGNFVGGTGFDLQDLVLSGHPAVGSGAVNLFDIRYVRIVDVIGHRVGVSSTDALGRAVSDPYPTPFASGGFDLTGVAVLNPPGAVAVEPSSWGRVKGAYRR